MFDAAGTLVQVYDATSNIRTDYVSGPNGGLARIKRIAGVDEVSFIHADHLGTGRVGTAWGGAQEWEDWHTPFGESLIHPDETDDQSDYTGHIRDKATGLTYMQARYYDPVIGRFLAEDPEDMLSQEFNPGYFNRYMYTMNDPVNAIDPDGTQVKVEQVGHQLRDSKVFGHSETQVTDVETGRAFNHDASATETGGTVRWSEIVNAKGKDDSGGDHRDALLEARVTLGPATNENGFEMEILDTEIVDMTFEEALEISTNHAKNLTDKKLQYAGSGIGGANSNYANGSNFKALTGRVPNLRGGKRRYPGGISEPRNIDVSEICKSCP